MKALFKNTTKYTEEQYWKFLKFHDSKYGMQYRILTIIVAIIILYLVSANIVARNLNLVYILFIAFVIFLFYRYFSQEKIVKDEIQGESLQKQKEYTFTFFEDELHIQDDSEEQYVLYKQLYRVHETSEYFYIYIDKKHSLMLAKSGFEVGNPDDFAIFMKKKFRHRFKANKK